MNKGMEIKFIGGKYQGHDGWFNAHKSHLSTPKRTYVIVIRKQEKDEKETYVSEDNLSSVTGIPRSHAQAVLQQQPKVEKAMKKVCKDLAMCCIEDEDIVELHNFFRDLLVNALANQKRTNPEQALYKHIDYDRAANKAAKKAAKQASARMEVSS